MAQLLKACLTFGCDTKGGVCVIPMKMGIHKDFEIIWIIGSSPIMTPKKKYKRIASR